MPATAEINFAATLVRPPVSRRPATTVFLPKEHGSWSLVLEPLALGLLIAPSWAGGALAAAVLAGFFARRPLKAAFSRKRQEVAENVSFSPGTLNETLTRSATARETVVMLSALAAAGLFEAGVLGGWSGLWPLLPAAGLGALFLRFDAQGDSRAALAEVAGSTAFAFVPAAMAALAGWPVTIALTLAGLAAARSIPAILAVRSHLRVAKGEPARGALTLLVSLLAFAVLATLAVRGYAPASAGWLGALLLIRTGWLVGPWRPAWPARRIGQTEAFLGILYVLLLSVAWPST